MGRDGITVGRYANRIAGAKLPLFFGEFELDANENGNTLHGGTEGFDKKEWTVTDHSPDRVCMELVSEDGDQGFPGTLKVKAEYSIDGGSLKITYKAESDAPTVINLTNHLYFWKSTDSLYLPESCWMYAAQGSITNGRNYSVRTSTAATSLKAKVFDPSPHLKDA